MRIAIELEVEGEVRAVEVPLALDSHEDTIRAAALCGMPAFQALAQGEWNPDAAKAILYINLVRYFNDNVWPEEEVDHLTAFRALDLDWGEFSSLNIDPVMEDSLNAISSIGEAD